MPRVGDNVVSIYDLTSEPRSDWLNSISQAQLCLEKQATPWELTFETSNLLFGREEAIKYSPTVCKK